jgi:hypothetical protein
MSFWRIVLTVAVVFCTDDIDSSGTRVRRRAGSGQWSEDRAEAHEYDLGGG